MIKNMMSLRSEVATLIWSFAPRLPGNDDKVVGKKYPKMWAVP